MKKIISFLLSVVLLLSLVPVLPVAQAEAVLTPQKTHAFITLNKNTSTIAHNVDQTIATVRKKDNNQQMIYYTMTVGLDEYTHIFANYKDNDYVAVQNKKYGLQEVTKQVDAAVKNHTDSNSERYIPNYTVVGAINGTGYDMSTGAPLYALVMEGKVAQDMSIMPNSSFFAIREDNTAMIGWTQAEFNNLIADTENPIKECIGGFNTVLIKNGEIQPNLHSTDPNARTAIGVSQDGKEVVMLVVDGKQAPTSEGCDMQQLAEILYEAGCYNAVNLDGGGSTTFVSRPVGESTYRVVSSPCDGAPRAVASSLLVVSTVPSSTDFESASITADAEYITPNGTINLTAKGISPAGTPVAIPSDVTWQVSEDYGTISGTGENVTFQSSGRTGKVDIKLMQNEKEVGNITVNVVNPTSFIFKRSTYAAPWGETFDIEFNVKYQEQEDGGEVIGEYDVKTHEGDITLTADPEDVVKINDITVTLPQEADTTHQVVTLKATFKDSGFSEQTAKLNLGKGSQAVFDFENNEDSDFGPDTDDLYEDAQNTISNGTELTAKIIDRDTGMVHSGDHALQVTIDYHKLLTSVGGSGLFSQTVVKYFGEQNLDITGAVGYGFWVWIPKEDNYMGIQIRVLYGDNNTGGVALGDNRIGVDYDEGHWMYIYYDLSTYPDGTKIKVNPRFFSLLAWGQDLGTTPLKSVNTKLTYYIDDVTVDYATVNDDRTMPVIGNVTATGTSDILTRSEVYSFGDNNNVSFTAPVSDAAEGRKNGINAESVKAYIDGEEINASCDGKEINTSPVSLTPGEHTLKLYISDNSGNTTNATRRFTVGGNAVTVNLVKSEKYVNTDKLPIDSVYWVDLAATDITKIQSVTTDLDLNNISKWELEHIELNPNFTMTATMEGFHAEDENVASLTFTRKTEGTVEYESNIIASIPVRVWGGDITKERCDKAQVWQYTKDGVKIGAFFPVDVSIEVEKGIIEYIPDYAPGVTATFGGTLQVDSELYDMSNVLVQLPENKEKKYWHFHEGCGTETINKAATCTDFGYSDRIVCAVCGAPIDDNSWGTVTQPTGHNYEVENGERKCKTCGATFTGEFDGRLYEDGKLVVGWQENNTYYKDGQMLKDGLYQIEETVDDKLTKRWHNFDANGICTELDRDEGYTGYYTKDDNGNYTAVEKLPQNVDLETNAYYYVEEGVHYDGWLFFRNGSEVEAPTPTEPGTDPATPEDQPTDPGEGTTDPNTENPGKDGGGLTEEEKQHEKDILSTVAYHVHKADGRIHSVRNEDTRTCVQSGYIIYHCMACQETKQSERLWWVGHQWRDPDNGDYYCTVCKTTGKDIAEASLNIMGKHFEYTGGGESGHIRAAVYVYHDGKQLSVRSDKNGHDGYVWYEKNTDIGVATVHIRGEGDYYGELTGTFEIVPQSVTTVDMTQTAASDADHVKVTLSWSRPLGAEFYDVWRYDYVKGDWIQVGKEVTDTTFSEELEVGTDYDYRVASRARDADGNIYYSVRWSDSVNGTIRHAWGAETDKVDATCTTDGQYKHTCTLCGYEETVTVPATGHKVDTWEITEQATTSAPGERRGTCTVCGETVTEEIPQLPPVITGTGNTTSPDAKQETVTNEDGSTTTTTTKPDGSKTETTTQTDGTVTEKNTEKSGVVTETTTKPDNTVTEKVTQTDGSATEKTTTPDGVVGQKSTDADGKVTSAEVVIPKEAEKQDVVTAPVEVPAAKSAAEAPEISVRTESTESKKVEIPVTEFGPGTVAVVVHEDGTEAIVRDCVMGENGVVLNVEGDVTLKIVDNTETFEDVEPANHWASNAVEFVAARELFNGTGENKFTPNGAMTRGMMVTVLYRLAYEPDTVAEQFADVPSGQYYSDAVAWAQNAGVVTGYDDNTFAPDDNVKREQLVTILYRYAKKMGYATTASGTLAGYADASSVSGWAADAMSWAIDIGLVNGVDATHLAPANNATRAEVATILMRFCEKVVK